MRDNNSEKEKKINDLATKILVIARDQIAVNLRFLDIALAEMKLIPKKDIKASGWDKHILRPCMDSENV